MSISAFRQIWQRIGRLLDLRRPRLSERLGSPAAHGELEIAEAALGMKLPKELKDCHSVHDGSREVAFVPFGSDRKLARPIMSLAEIVAHHRMMREGVLTGAFSGTDFENHPTDPIRQAWFHRGWIPVVQDQSGDYFLLDTAPAKGGKRGQIIHFDRLKGANVVIAPSLLRLLKSAAEDIESDRYALDRNQPFFRRVDRT